MFTIYKVTTCDDFFEGRIYIGCTSRPIKTRMSEHVSHGTEFTKFNFQVEILHKVQTFERGQILEAYYIEKYDTTNPQKGWNRRLGGNAYSFADWVIANMGRSRPGNMNPMFGRKHSDATKEKIRQKAKGRKSWCTGMKFSEERKARMRKARAGKGYMKGKDHPMYGKRHSKKAKEKIGAAQSEWQKTHDNPFLGRKHTEETKRKMRESKT